MRLKHVLFDNDGTIVDSEYLAAKITLQHLSLVGLQLTEHDYNKRFPGLRTRDIVALLEKEFGFKAPTDFIQRIHEDHKLAYRKSLKAIKGMPGLFKSLKVPKSMVSNGSIHHVDQCLKRVRLRSNLDGLIFSAEQVSRPKPAPDVYVFALEKLGLAAHETIVVEDSAIGIIAAKSAGIQTVGFLGASHIQTGHRKQLEAAGADIIVQDAIELTTLFKKNGVV